MRRSEPISGSHKVDQLNGEGLLPRLDLLEENDALVAGPGADVALSGLECIALALRKSLPLVGQLVADLDQAVIKVGLRGVTRRIEPLVPVQLVKLLAGL